ncbi:MAG: chorismate lyase [Gammaproteobacteria bacterium]
MTIHSPSTLQQPDGVTRWATWQEDHPKSPAPDVAALLRCEASLTAALRAHSDDQLGLEVLREESTELAPLQAGELASPRGVVREVVLSGRDVPWVFAQTLIPLATSRAHSWLSSMGGKPLGDALFHHPDVQRSDLLFAQLASGSALYDRATEVGLVARSPFLWARRSYFFLGDERLLITEVFLPGLCPHR